MSDVKSSGSATIAERVHRVIRHVLALETDAVAGTSRLKEDLGADSVDAVMLVMAIEKEFNGEISDDEYVGLSTVDEVVALITRHAAGSGIS
jgi:acyl carrier protein